MAEKLYFYPVWIRIWHWLNALMFLFLIVTGLSMQYSSPDYPLIRFDIAVSVHNIAGIIVTIGYFVFVVGNMITANGRFYKFKISDIFDQVKKQFLYYTFGIFKHESAPFPLSESRKFNPLQKLSYVFAMYAFVPILIISGLGLLFPETIIPKVFGISGIHLTDLVHILSGFVLSVFMVIHIYFCTIGKSPTANFKSMFTGWH
jgi:thiosulfate reductase cytochrome b subunit